MQHELSPQRMGGEAARKGECTISDLARAYDVSLRTLRFYEDKGLLRPRRQGTARFYSGADRTRLELILKGKRLGFTLAEIQELIDSRSRSTHMAPETENDLTVSLDREKIASQIAHLQRQRDELDSAIDELRGALERMMGIAG